MTGTFSTARYLFLIRFSSIRYGVETRARSFFRGAKLCLIYEVIVVRIVGGFCLKSFVIPCLIFPYFGECAHSYLGVFGDSCILSPFSVCISFRLSVFRWVCSCLRLARLCYHGIPGAICLWLLSAFSCDFSLEDWCSRLLAPIIILYKHFFCLFLPLRPLCDSLVIIRQLTIN